jgi:hypothetical protein
MMEVNWFSYLWKTWLTIVALYGLSLILQYLPAFILFFCLISVINTLTLMYLLVINKTVVEHRHISGSFVSRLNQKKIVPLFVAIITSFMATFFLLLEVPTWHSFDWAAVLGLAVLFYPLYKGLGLLTGTQYKKGLYREIYKNRFAPLIPLVLVLLFALYDYYFISPTDEYRNVSEAFYYYQYKNVLNQSPSLLIHDMAQIMTMKDTFRDYIMNKVFLWFPGWRFVWLLLAYAAVSFSFISICLLFKTPWPQLKRIFLPLYDEEEYTGNTRMQKTPIVIMAALHLLVIVLFIVCESRYASQVTAGDLPWLRGTVQNWLNDFVVRFGIYV